MSVTESSTEDYEETKDDINSSKIDSETSRQKKTKKTIKRKPKRTVKKKPSLKEEKKSFRSVSSLRSSHESENSVNQRAGHSTSELIQHDSELENRVSKKYLEVLVPELDRNQRNKILTNTLDLVNADLVLNEPTAMQSTETKNFLKTEDLSDGYDHSKCDPLKEPSVKTKRYVIKINDKVVVVPTALVESSKRLLLENKPKPPLHATRKDFEIKVPTTKQSQIGILRTQSADRTLVSINKVASWIFYLLGLVVSTIASVLRGLYYALYVLCVWYTILILYEGFNYMLCSRKFSSEVASVLQLHKQVELYGLREIELYADYYRILSHKGVSYSVRTHDQYKTLLEVTKQYPLTEVELKKIQTYVTSLNVNNMVLRNLVESLNQQNVYIVLQNLARMVYITYTIYRMESKRISFFHEFSAVLPMGLLLRLDPQISYLIAEDDDSESQPEHVRLRSLLTEVHHKVQERKFSKDTLERRAGPVFSLDAYLSEISNRTLEEQNTDIRKKLKKKQEITDMTSNRLINVKRQSNSLV